MKNSDPRISHRQATEDAIIELRETVNKVLVEMLNHGCPCRYPRFRYLMQFQHANYNAGPVLCADTNFLIYEARAEDLGFLQLTDTITDNIIGDFSADLVYTCCKCGTVYKYIEKQYSINFVFKYFIIMEDRHGADIGADLILPFPLLQGLYGFNESDILICAKDYTLGSADEFFSYMTARK